MLLGEYGTQGEVRGIGFDNCLSVWIEVLEHRSCGEEVNKLLLCCFDFGGASPFIRGLISLTDRTYSSVI